MRSETREELANYLLNHCFIIGNLESTREKYYLLTNNEEEMQEIFRPLGYSIVINRNLRVAQLVNLHELGRVELRKYESILLLIFRLLYVEKRETLSVSEQLVSIEGTPPNMIDPPAGCAFSTRCAQCMRICQKSEPPMFEFEDGHTAQCWLYHPMAAQGNEE